MLPVVVSVRDQWSLSVCFLLRLMAPTLDGDLWNGFAPHIQSCRSLFSVHMSHFTRNRCVHRPYGQTWHCFIWSSSVSVLAFYFPIIACFFEWPAVTCTGLQNSSDHRNISHSTGNCCVIKISWALFLIIIETSFPFSRCSTCHLTLYPVEFNSC